MIKRVREFAGVIASFEIWVVGCAVAAGLVYSRALPLAVGAAVCFWLLRGFAYRRLSLRTPADWAVALLVMMILVTLWTTAFPDFTYPQVYRLLSGIALYYALANWAITPGRLCWVLRGTVAAGFLLAIFATISVEWFTNKLPFIPASLYSHFHILVTDAVNPNVMAGSMVILLPVALAILLFGWRQVRWIERVLTCLAALGMTVVLILTQSRGAWVAIGVVLGVLVALRWRWGWLAIILVVAGGVFGIECYGAARLLEALLAGGSIAGLEGRIEIWQRALFMIRDFPFTGIGMGNFGYVSDTLYPFYIYPSGTVFHAHNLFLQIAVDMGLPGLIAWLSLLFTTTIAAWQSYRFGQHYGLRWMSGLGAGLLLSQLALVLHGLIDAVMWGMVRSAPLVWFTWGLAVASANLVVKAQRIKRVPNSTAGS